MFADTIYDLYRKGNGIIPERRAELIHMQQQAVFPRAADLRGADLSGADLSGADLSEEAVFPRADFAAITRADDFEPSAPFDMSVGDPYSARESF